jgi:hypothetical protein
MTMKEFFQTRPCSWSCISSFHYNKEEWYETYIEGKKKPQTKEMIFGSMVGKKLETDPTFLPQIERLSKMEHPFNFVFNGIKMTGYADSFCNITNKKLREYKSGKKEWDQKRVDEHGQLTLYTMGNYITTKVLPEDVDIALYWMPTQENGDFSISFVEPIEEHIKMFKTKRTMNDLINFGRFINTTVEEMDKYVESRKK